MRADRRTIRQTDRQTDILIAVLRTRLDGGVLKEEKDAAVACTAGLSR